MPATLLFSFVTIGSWQSFGTTFQFALLNGGAASMFYGGLLACIGETAVVISLAELASIDPTVGAQYRWSANLAPAYGRFWGLLQGWLTTFAWCFAAGGPPSLIANLITSLVVFNNESYVPERWHTSLIMISSMVPIFVANLWFRKVLNTFEFTGGILHVCLFITFIAILLAMGTRTSDTDSVFKSLAWGASGWNNKGVCFGLGTLSTVFSLAGVDGLLHMCDEVKNVRTSVPRGMVFAVTGNALMMFVFIIVLLLYMTPLTDAEMNTGLPILYVIYNATGSRAATNIVFIAMTAMSILCFFNVFASVSRLVWQFAQDKGLPFSQTLSYLHPTLGLPVNALILVLCVVTCLSLVYIGSATAFNALIALQALALHISYFFPIFFMLIRRLRGPAPPYGPFSLGREGVYVNAFSLAFLVYITIWMPFPTILPVTADNMNYAGPIFGVVLVGALLDWVISGRTRFEMPVKKYD